MKNKNKNKKSDSYKNIFKSTFLFGFVQIFNILIKVLLNKAAAVFLGAEGIGLIGIFQSISEMLKTFFGFGISQSAVRDISKANNDKDKEKFSKIITVIKKVVWFTALSGAIFTIIFSSYLSTLSFGNSDYTYSFILISIVVLLNILVDGQLSILKGMRQLRALAKASVFGSFAGLLFGVPFYYFLGKDGIIPTLLVVGLTAFAFSTYYVKKVQYTRLKLSIKETLTQSSSMVKMGMALMFVAFAGMVSEYIIKIYVSNNSNLNMVGIYQVGLTIVSGYFSIIIVAMMTDYYPRISAIFDDNNKLMEELNKQAKVGLILITPLIVVFMFLMPYFVILLYSDNFLLSVEYMRYAIFWTLIIIVSNPIDMILIAKQNTKVFLLATIFYRVIGVSISLYGFSHFGIKGLGIAMLIMGIIHIALMQSIMYKLYNIKLQYETIKMLFISIILTLLSFYISDLNNYYIKYSLGILVLIISILYSIRHFNDITNLNIYDFIKSKLKRKN